MLAAMMVTQDSALPQMKRITPSAGAVLVMVVRGELIGRGTHRNLGTAFWECALS